MLYQDLHASCPSLGLAQMYESVVIENESLRLNIKKLSAELGELQRSKGLFESILESAADAIITLNAAGTMELTNRSSERLFGYGRGELIGHNISFTHS